MGYNDVANNTGLCQIYELSRNSERIRAYSSSRSSEVIDFDVNRRPMCECDLLLVAVSPTVFEILTLKLEKLENG